MRFSNIGPIDSTNLVNYLSNYLSFIVNFQKKLENFTMKELLQMREKYTKDLKFKQWFIK